MSSPLIQPLVPSAWKEIMRILLLLSLVFVGSLAHAIEIASCYSPKGTAYYPEIGLMSKKNSGWTEDKISDGIFKLSMNKENEFDILFVDATKKINSSVEQGGRVLLFSHGQNQVTFLVLYPGQTAEIYTFLQNASGKYEYIHVTSRSGDSALITKASIMQGECGPINFEVLQ